MLPGFTERAVRPRPRCGARFVSVAASDAGGRFFFFFQAEDGIRGHCVTGVQTCALPISSSCATPAPGRSTTTTQSSRRSTRSEERRVGKECRARGSPYHYKKKEGHK